MKFLYALFISLGLLLSAGTAQAYIITSYNEHITGSDYYNSSNVRLYGIRNILRQARANYHRFGIRHAGDGYDSFFNRASNRNWFNNRRVVVSSRVRNALRSGRSIHVYVTVHSHGLIVVR